MRRVIFMSLLFGAALAVTPLRAEMAATQPPPAGPPAYGETITMEQAKKAAAAAADEAKKINTFMAIAVVSPSGDLVYFEKMDNTQYASINIAIHKARTAARFRRPTSSFEERVGQGGVGLTLLTLDDIIASPGGNPIIVGGKLIGAIGLSGGTGAQDNQASLAGVNALK
jgi:glc operon protein GlcG